MVTSAKVTNAMLGISIASGTGSNPARRVLFFERTHSLAPCIRLNGMQWRSLSVENNLSLCLAMFYSLVSVTIATRSLATILFFSFYPLEDKQKCNMSP